MKKNLVVRIAAIVLMCTLVTACFASSTFARYTSNATGNDSVVVAKWSITAQGEEIAVTGDAPEVSIDLFNVTTVAPGSEGSLAFDSIVNNSQVPATITITVKSITNNDGVPIVLKSGSKEIKAGDTVYTGTVAAGDTLAAATVGSVDWSWVTTSDAADTALGIKAQNNTLTYSVVFEITAVQA